MNNDIDEVLRRLSQKEIEYEKLKIKYSLKERELHLITQSKSYKAGRLLFKSKYAILYTVGLLRKYNPISYSKSLIRINKVQKSYVSSDFLKLRDINRSSNTVLVVHLYYIEMLDYFVDISKRLKNISPDIIITTPQDNLSLVEGKLSKILPAATVVPVPNCGRDVLPFVEVMKAIRNTGYQNVIKIHSKKSPHTKDGEAWREQIIEALIPKSGTASHVEKIIELLDYPDVAIVGPDGQYVSSLVNYNSTRTHLKKVLSRIYSKDKVDNVVSNIDEYGFFAGTMFWARIDALMPVIDSVSAREFEPELGQQDSTLAHALERLFVIVPEINGKKIYTSGESGVTSIDYHTTVIPTWAKEHPDYIDDYNYSKR